MRKCSLHNLLPEWFCCFAHAFYILCTTYNILSKNNYDKLVDKSFQLGNKFIEENILIFIYSCSAKFRKRFECKRIELLASCYGRHMRCVNIWLRRIFLAFCNLSNEIWVWNAWWGKWSVINDITFCLFECHGV